MGLKSRKAELKQRVQVNLAKYVGIFCHDCSYNTRFVLTNTKPVKFPKNQNIPNTPSRCLEFSFSTECLSNFPNCLKGR